MASPLVEVAPGCVSREKSRAIASTILASSLDASTAIRRVTSLRHAGGDCDEPVGGGSPVFASQSVCRYPIYSVGWPMHIVFHVHLALHFLLSHSYFLSTHANVDTNGFRRKGRSCAIRSRPRGSIHTPSTGKKLKMPPRTRSTAMTSRTANEDGRRSHRMNLETLVGTRRSITSKYLFSAVFVVVICQSLHCSGGVLAGDNVWIGQRSPKEGGQSAQRRIRSPVFGRRKWRP